MKNLLERRILVINGFPGMQEFAIEKDEIITNNINGYEIAWEKYPHLFRFLEWHEKRSVEELKHIKFVKINIYRAYWSIGDIVPAKLRLNDSFDPVGFILDGGHYQPLDELLPASEIDYNNFKNRI
jgi:hypothetical protein